MPPASRSIVVIGDLVEGWPPRYGPPAGMEAARRRWQAEAADEPPLSGEALDEARAALAVTGGYLERLPLACIKAGLNPFFVNCYAPEDRLRRRITERMADGTDASDAHVAILDEQLRLCEEPSELPPHRLLRLNTDAELHELAGALREFL